MAARLVAIQLRSCGCQMLITGDRITAIALLTLGLAGFFVADATLPSRAGMLPKASSAALSVFSVALFLRPTNKDFSDPFAHSWLRLLAAIIATLIYFALSGFIGFISSTFLFIASIGYFGGFQRLRFLLVSAAAFSVVAYLLFAEFFRLALPPEWFLALVSEAG